MPQTITSIATNNFLFAIGCSLNNQEEIARNALAEGASIEFVQKITGLDINTIKKLQ